MNKTHCTTTHACTQAGPSVFVSFRVAEADTEARWLKRLLETRGVPTFVSSVDIKQVRGTNKRALLLACCRACSLACSAQLIDSSSAHLFTLRAQLSARQSTDHHGCHASASADPCEVSCLLLSVQGPNVGLAGWSG